MEVALWIAVVASCGSAQRGSDSECEMFPRRREPPPPLADLSAVRRFHHYLGVADVAQVGHHFTVWYRDIEPAMVRVRVGRTAGRLDIASEGGYWGGMAVAPKQMPPVRPEAAGLAREVVAELQRRCPPGRDFRVSDDGLSRTVTVHELIAHDDRSGTTRVGWYAKVQLAVDESLTKVIGVGEQWSAFGQFESPAATQWFAVPPSDLGTLALAGDVQRLAAPILEAARRRLANEPSPTLASLTPEGDALSPPGLVARVEAAVTLYAKPRSTGSDVLGEELAANLDVRDAVFGAGATGEATRAVGDRVVRLQATLTPAAQREPGLGRSTATYAGTLVVRISDDSREHWERSYAVSGDLELEGDTVIAPYGFSMKPQPDREALSGQLAGGFRAGGVSFTLDPSLFDDPRR